jgi:hypothetical protein
MEQLPIFGQRPSFREPFAPTWNGSDIAAADQNPAGQVAEAAQQSIVKTIQDGFSEDQPKGQL